MIDENFFVEDRFYSQIGDYIDDAFPENGDIDALPDDWFIRVQKSKLTKPFQLSVSRIVDLVMEDAFDLHEDKMPIDNEYEINEIRNSIRKGIDTKLINEAIPSYYYPDGFGTITKQDLLNYLSD